MSALLSTKGRRRCPTGVCAVLLLAGLMPLPATADAVDLSAEQQAMCEQQVLSSPDPEKWTDLDELCLRYRLQRVRADDWSTGLALTVGQKLECDALVLTETDVEAWSGRERRCVEYWLVERPATRQPLTDEQERKCDSDLLLTSLEPRTWSEMELACVEHWLDKEAKANDQVSVKLTLGSSGDEAKAIGGTEGESEKQYRVDLGFSLGQGSYPQQFSFTSGAGVRFEEGALEEEVSSLALHYDRYLAPLLPRFEGWVFAIRSTDSFLQIEERYDVGVGLDWEYWVGANRLPAECPEDQQARAQANPERTSRHEEAIEGQGRNFWFNKRGGDGPRTPPTRRMQAFEALAALNWGSKFARKYCKNFHGIVQRQSTWVFSLGFSVFSEFEEVEDFKIFLDPISPTGEVMQSQEAVLVSVDAEQRFRYAIRPSVRFRPTENLSFVARVYFKQPLDSPREIDGHRDERTEAEAEVRYVVKEPDKATVVLRWDYWYDPLPPGIPQAMLDELTGDGQSFEVRGATRADGRHWRVKLGLEFGF